jgi:hypothetical protein
MAYFCTLLLRHCKKSFFLAMSNRDGGSELHTEFIELWHEADEILAQDRDVQVPCPVCREAVLQVDDVVTSSALERHMTCLLCGANNYLRLGSLPHIG